MSFDVLSRQVSLNTHFLVEASAGTGKTFTIEHLFVRRLLELDATGEYVEPSQIAVLTFTRAVARELVERIGRCIDSAIVELQGLKPLIADYLKVFIEQHNEMQAIARLKACKSMLETACIGTIHSFCHRMLADWQASVSQETFREITQLELERLVDDYFRMQLEDEPIAITSLSKVLAFFKNDFQELRQALINKLWEENKSQVVCFEELKTLCSGLKIPLDQLVGSFTGCCTRSGEVKQELAVAINALKEFCQDPDNIETRKNLILYPLYATEWFSKPKAKAKADLITNDTIVALHAMEPIVRALSDPSELVAGLRKKVRTYVLHKMDEKGLFSYKALLYKMVACLQDDAFSTYLQNRFSCLIVDEFQDTDPVQWGIIKELFLKRQSSSLYLVGDPKQAIYAFRNADVYSYMAAKKTLGTSPYVLSKNFRSSVRLIQGLNLLFSGPHSEKFFYLPKINQSIQPPPITAGASIEELDEGMGAITFFQAGGKIERKRSWPTPEVENQLFSYIALEIARLNDPGNTCVLVKDRYQLARIKDYLDGCGIEVATSSRHSVVGSKAYVLLKKLIECCQNPRDKRALISFLIESPLQYGEKEIAKFLEESNEALMIWATSVQHIVSLRAIFEEKGFACFFKAFLETVWDGTHTIEELILLREEGVQVLRDLELLFDHLVAEKNLDRLHRALLSCSDDSLFTRFDHDKKGVRLLTMHAAKGLEFDIVFALGLASRHMSDEADIEEVQAEKSRLFYVAATRAKRKLYIPIARVEDKETINPKSISPCELFLQSLSGGIEELCRISDGALALVHVEQTSAILSEKKHFQYAKKQAASFSPIVQRTYFSSFSSLKEHVVHRPIHQETSFDIPLGVQTGLLVHELLEKICRLASNSGHFPDKEYFDSFLLNELQGTYFESCKELVVQNLWDAFHVSLGSFSLCQLDWKKAYCEVEIVSQETKNSWMRGVIDLAFEHEGRVYLLDWKSNWLENGYSNEALRKALYEHQYDLQAKLYSRAFKKIQPNFAGFFFLFIRKPQQGVLFLSEKELL